MDQDKLHYSFEKKDINKDVVFSFLKDSYWGKSYELEKYWEALDHSLVISLFLDNKQIGFARVVTDGYYVGYLADVFIVDELQGKGLGSFMLKKLFESEAAKKINRITLSTRDQQTFYKRFGFQELRYPKNQMEKLNS